MSKGGKIRVYRQEHDPEHNGMCPKCKRVYKVARGGRCPECRCRLLSEAQQQKEVEKILKKLRSE